MWDKRKENEGRGGEGRGLRGAGYFMAMAVVSRD